MIILQPDGTRITPGGQTVRWDHDPDPERDAMLATQASQLAISAATHVYLGMFRPPWEPINDSFQDQMNSQRAGEAQIALITNCFGQDWTYTDDEELRRDYLAGHFDVPQYRLKDADELLRTIK